MVARRRAVPGPAAGDLSHDASNSGTHTSATAEGAGFGAEALLSFIERYERMTEEIDALQADRKEIMAEAKGTGYDTKIMLMVIRERKMDKGDLQERDAILDLYRAGVARAEKARYDKSIADGADADEPE